MRACVYIYICVYVCVCVCVCIYTHTHMRIAYRPGSSIGINRPASRRVNLTTQKALPKCQQTTHKHPVGTIVFSSQVIVGMRVGFPETFEATHGLLPTSYVHLAVFYASEYTSKMIISRLATIRTSEVGATKACHRSNKNL